MPIDPAQRKARLLAPPGACETHSHVYDPARFPYPEGVHGEPPATTAMYEAMLASLGVERGVIVQPSAYLFDNRATMDAVASMGLARARAVVVVHPTQPDAEFRRLHAAGARGLRFFLAAPGLSLGQLLPMAARIAPLGWHVQIQDAEADFLAWLPYLYRLPENVQIVTDHVGRTPLAGGVNNPSFVAMLRFMETGRLWMKLSAFYYSQAGGAYPYADAKARVQAAVRARPDRLVWAANWPHPGFPADAKPDDVRDFDLLGDWIAEEGTRNAILAGNPARLYGFPD
ncbi:MAG: amidohydrolase family protein [Alphaproteobacteria bacterium]|nr:amidohydrolase family protein [Alphaproteobacteria bacterium]